MTEISAADAAKPWPRAQRMPAAVVGGRPQPWHLEAVAEYDAAHGTATEPNSTIPGMYAAAQINQAITWWNERVDSMRAESSAAEAAERCPTVCDPDCDADCHEWHQVLYKRRHQPEQCPGAHSVDRQPISDDELVRMQLRAETASTYEEHHWVGRDSRRLIAEVRTLRAEADRLRASNASDTDAYVAGLEQIHSDRDHWQNQAVAATERAEQAEAEVRRYRSFCGEALCGDVERDRDSYRKMAATAQLLADQYGAQLAQMQVALGHLTIGIDGYETDGWPCIECRRCGRDIWTGNDHNTGPLTLDQAIDLGTAHHCEATDG